MFLQSYFVQINRFSKFDTFKTTRPVSYLTLRKV